MFEYIKFYGSAIALLLFVIELIILMPFIYLISLRYPLFEMNIIETLERSVDEIKERKKKLEKK